MGVRFFKFIFLLFRSLEAMISEFLLLLANKFSIALIDKSLATLVNYSGLSTASSPIMLLSNAVFYKFYPPIFFKAFNGESLPLALLSFSKIFNFSGSIPLSSLSKFLVNSLVYFPFY